jgi:pimeloyl-ACP methyl ester carboxylesterase
VPAVLLCYPGPQEYNMTHWAFRKLSAALARDGAPVLRFDYTGTGDSSGSMVDGDLDTWVADIRTAHEELRDQSGIDHVSIVAMRLGAALAARACAEGLEVRDLVLWEPVVSGARYLDELESLDRREQLRLLHPANDRSRDELAGHRLTPTQRDAIARIDLRQLGRPSARRVSIFVSEEKPLFVALREALRVAGADSALHVVTEHAAVTNAGAREAALLSNKILGAMAAELANGTPE